MKVLVVDCDVESRDRIALVLRMRWPDAEVICCQHPGDLESSGGEHPQVVILGFTECDICHALAEVRKLFTAPVVALIAEADDTRRLSFLEAGGDDVIANPLKPLELMATVNALLRRSAPGLARSNVYTFGEFTIHFGWHEIAALGKVVAMTPNEHALLNCLVQNEGRTVAKRILSQAIWPEEEQSIGRDQDLRKHVYRVRTKLQEIGCPADVIHTSRGVGYRFIAPG